MSKMMPCALPFEVADAVIPTELPATTVWLLGVAAVVNANAGGCGPRPTVTA